MSGPEDAGQNSWLGCYLIGCREIQFETSEVYENALNCLKAETTIITTEKNHKRHCITFTTESVWAFLDLWCKLHKPAEETQCNTSKAQFLQQVYM